MAMTTGSVVVANNGSEVKSGAAEAIYDVLVVQAAADFAPDPLPSGPDGAKIRQGLAKLANAVAAIVPYIQANAELTVSTDVSDAGMQRSTSIGTDTAAPGTAFQGGGVI